MLQNFHCVDVNIFTEKNNSKGERLESGSFLVMQGEAYMAF